MDDVRVDHPEAVAASPLSPLTARGKNVDITGMAVTKLPPGKARGADDLSTWAGRRLANRSNSDNGPDAAMLKLEKDSVPPKDRKARRKWRNRRRAIFHNSA